jgi:hypothetical protein
MDSDDLSGLSRAAAAGLTILTSGGESPSDDNTPLEALLGSPVAASAAMSGVTSPLSSTRSMGLSSSCPVAEILRANSGSASSPAPSPALDSAAVPDAKRRHDAFLRGVSTWAEWQRILHPILASEGTWNNPAVGTKRHAELLQQALLAWVEALPDVDWGYILPLLSKPVLRGFEFHGNTLVTERQLDSQFRVGFLRHPTKAISLLGYIAGAQVGRCDRCRAPGPSTPYSDCVVVAIPASAVDLSGTSSTPKRKKKAKTAPSPKKKRKLDGPASLSDATSGPSPPEQLHEHRRVLPGDAFFDEGVEQVYLYQGACMSCAWNGKDSSCSFHPAYVAPTVPTTPPAAPTILTDGGKRAAFLARMQLLGMSAKVAEGLIANVLGHREENVEEIKDIRRASRAAKKAKKGKGEAPSIGSVPAGDDDSVVFGDA